MEIGVYRVRSLFKRDVSLLVSGRELAPPSNSLAIAEENISVQLLNLQQYD
jgi:hypothetical protein